MTFRLIQRDSPLLVSVPHAGLRLPEGLRDRLSETGRALDDTDWLVDQLAETIDDRPGSLLLADFSRVVVDLNRSPDDLPLYSGPGTGLVPTESFAGRPLYLPGEEPGLAEIKDRIQAFWRPYHDALSRLLIDKRARYGRAILLDLHSITSRVPRLFDGTLPPLNLGTNSGQSCAPELAGEVIQLFERQQEFEWVINGRFTGGYITRHHGRPERQIHALQLEIAQRCYLDERQPQRWEPGRAHELIRFLERLLQCLDDWGREQP